VERGAGGKGIVGKRDSEVRTIGKESSGKEGLESHWKRGTVGNRHSGKVGQRKKR
jgi:hypothetical protein